MGGNGFHPNKSSGWELDFQKSQIVPVFGYIFSIKKRHITLKNKDISIFGVTVVKGQASVARCLRTPPMAAKR